MKSLFDFLTLPLSLPIEWYWEIIGMALIGVIAYKVSFSIVGCMYRFGVIEGSLSGKFFHWFIRLIVFILLWCIASVVILLFGVTTN